MWQRDFYDAFIVACPDESVVGKSIGQVADERAVHVVDTFLDLLVEHGKKLRWRTVLANDRPDEVARMLNEPSAIVGFADSGAHLRNMAFYSVPLRTLRFVKERHEAGKPVMPIEKAVYRLTHEAGSWLGVDAGRLQRGDRADLVVIDPNALDERLDAYHEASIAEFGGMQRMVNRSDGAVKYVLVNGNIALDDGSFAPDLGTASTYGTFLPGSFGARA